jgi:WD40 repeat protein
MAIVDGVNVVRPGGDGVRRRHALVVGIDRYLDAKLRLQFCAADAARLAGVLTTNGFAVTALHDGAGRNARPTLANVTKALAALMKAADADDLVVVFFSCHGRLVDGRPHLMLADTPSSDDGLRTGGLPLASLLAALRGAPRWVAIFLDVCHMGIGLEPSTGASTDHGVEKAGGFALLAGSTSGQITQDTTGAGVFSKSVIDGLAGAAADVDGAVRFSALARHVQAEVARWRASDEGKKKLASQTPVLRLEIADLELVPARGYTDLHPAPRAKITSASFTPDGRRLATGGEDRAVRLWDARTGAALHAPMLHDADVWGVAFSPDGDELISGDDGGGYRVWTTTSARAATRQPRRLRTGINGVAWSLDGTCRAIAADDGLYLHTLSDTFGVKPGLRRLHRTKYRVWSVAFTHELFGLVTGDAEHNVRAWDYLVGSTSIIGRHEGPVWAVAASPDGEHVAAAGSDIVPGASKENVARIWDTGSDAVVTLRGHRAAVTALAYSPDGAWVATSCYDGLVRVFAAATGALTRELALVVDGTVRHPEAYAVTFAPDGRRLFAGYADGHGRLFELT